MHKCAEQYTQTTGRKAVSYNFTFHPSQRSSDSDSLQRPRYYFGASVEVYAYVWSAKWQWDSVIELVWELVDLCEIEAAIGQRCWVSITFPTSSHRLHELLVNMAPLVPGLAAWCSLSYPLLHPAILLTLLGCFHLALVSLSPWLTQ